MPSRTMAGRFWRGARPSCGRCGGISTIARALDGICRRCATGASTTFACWGSVGAPGGPPGRDSWRDRRADPSAADYDKNIAGLTDWAYQRGMGLRVQWSIFGGTEFTPTPESRRAVVERFAAMSKGREQAIFAFEVANESFQNGLRRGDRVRKSCGRLAKNLKAGAPNLVALSSPEGSDCRAAQALYRNSAADLLTLHMGRAGERNGRPLEVVASGLGHALVQRRAEADKQQRADRPSVLGC